MSFKTKEQIYNNCVSKGFLTPIADHDSLKIERNMEIIDENLKSVKILIPEQHWNSIYILSYNALHTITETLLIFDKVKSHNHQCLFAHLCVKHPKLELNWDFFEKVRTKRNGLQYYGKEVTKKDFKDIELQMNLYINTLKKEIERKVKK
ncbi:MAG: hypothetical protein ABIB43_01265 [archaeon]